MIRYLVMILIALFAVAAHAADYPYSAGFNPLVPGQTEHVVGSATDNFAFKTVKAGTYTIEVVGAKKFIPCTPLPRCVSPGMYWGQPISVDIVYNGTVIKSVVGRILNTGVAEFNDTVALSAKTSYTLVATVVGQGTGTAAGEGDYSVKLSVPGGK